MPVYTDESTWPRYALTVNVPDVKCERCLLQMASLMTDAIHGVPEGTSCALRGSGPHVAGVAPACPAVYYSCATVRINGTRPVSPEAPLSCPAGDADAALEWPWTARQVPGVYLHEGDPGDWTPRYPVDLGAALNATTTSNATSSAPAYARRAGVCGPEAPTIDLCGVHGGACR